MHIPSAVFKTFLETSIHMYICIKMILNTIKYTDT